MKKEGVNVEKFMKIEKILYLIELKFIKFD